MLSMKKIVILLAVFLTSQLTVFSQDTSNPSISTREVRTINDWTFGVGLSNFIMHGDLRSIGTGMQGNYYNFGGYIYADKMFNPLLGVEFKLNYFNMEGGSQYFSNVYDILYVPDTQITDNLYYTGRAYGFEMNLILNFFDAYGLAINQRNWHLQGMFGMGYHVYNSALFEINDDGTSTLLIDYGTNVNRNNQNEATSVYISGQLSLKYSINRTIDIELRPGWYFNYEDHLDATISNKQNWETFFVTHLGLAFNLSKKRTMTVTELSTGTQNDIPFNIVDSDGDGVMDQLDKEPDTPLGVMVYGNGVSVDSDKDGLPDHKDKCPLVFGDAANEGCPLIIDTDKDGIPDDKDLCPTVAGIAINKGCPELKKEVETPKINIEESLAALASAIYFDLGKDEIRRDSYKIVESIAIIINQAPNTEFIVEGHTDSQDNNRFNVYLSQRRAANVRKELIRLGVDPSKITAVGYGESKPKFSNLTREGRLLNRRVEVKVKKAE